MRDLPTQRILIATDAWHPQVNGVVRTMETTIQILEEHGHTVELIEPAHYLGFPCPIYPEVRLSLAGTDRIRRVIEQFRPERVHIATEGPIGLALRQFCLRRRIRYTTSYHTKFPEYLTHLLRLPTEWGYRYMRWFHSESDGLMVATPTLEQELRNRGFRGPLVRWSRGVDLSLFRPRPKTLFDFPRPILLYVGRVSREKSVEDFLKLTVKGTKVVVGDGPIRARLEREYPDAKFLGYRTGEALAEVYANADVFIFPSRTDTFGLVQVEALASGVPVAAYPAVGPLDIISCDQVGAIDEDLNRAVERALAHGVPAECVRVAHEYTWEHCTYQFLRNTVPVK